MEGIKVEILQVGIKDIAKRIRNKEISPVEIVEALLNQLDKENKKYNAFITVDSEKARREAKRLEKEIMDQKVRSPLHGVPISIKDNIHVKGVRLTNGSIVEELIPNKDAPIVQHLRANGAIIIGKTNMDEFANNIVGRNQNFGTIKNPIHSDHVAGGSSGGSAVSVATHLSYGSIGTDTSGSVRIPASCCGVTGLKPTNGIISMEGITPLSWSLDVAGVFAKNCVDAALLFQSMTPGSTNSFLEVDSPNQNDNFINGLRIGVFKNYFISEDEAVKQAMKQVVDQLENNGAILKELEIDHVEQFMEHHIPLASTEAYYYFSQMMEDTDPSLYAESNYHFFETGKNTTTKRYLEARQFRDKLMYTFREQFANVDVIITPTLPILPPTLEEFQGDWEHLLGKMIKFTGPISMSGLPALSIPLSMSENRLSIGVQLIGDLFQENKILSIGDWLMKSGEV